MATGPQIPTDPIELLTPDLSRPEPFINQFWGPGICGSLMFGACYVSNILNKYPGFSGLHRTLILTGLAGLAGQYLDSKRRDYYAERDAAMRHYITLHREDFPIAERQKFADVFQPWVPIR